MSWKDKYIDKFTSIENGYNMRRNKKIMENILRQVYYNESGFGGIAETYKEAKQIF